ncbi:MAG: hypothetical protein JO212_20190 [Acetobacteraceae bacterium]|nr:hypothetical protein [Acetobacteraceae bacterium]
MSVPGAKTISTEEMQRLLAESKPLILTTAQPRYNPTIPGAVQIDLPGGGTMDDEFQANLRRMMQALLGDDRERPIVVFSYSINHWYARNAALRLVALGYRNVYWYRGGWEAWDAHDLPKAPLILEAR